MKLMKLDYSKKWYENRIAREGDAEIGAGTPPGAQTKALAKSNVTSSSAVEVVELEYV